MAEAEEPQADAGALSTRFIVSYAVFWLMGLGFIWWLVAVARGLSRPSTDTRVDWLATTAVTMLGCSLLVAAVSGGAASRLASALYNLVVWVAVVAIARRGVARRDLLAGLAYLGAIQSIFTVIAFVVFPTLYRLPLPAAYVLPRELAGDAAFGNFLYARLVQQDYFGEVVLRTGGFLGNPTWGASLTAMSLVASVVLLCDRRRPVGLKAVFLLVTIPLSAFCLYTSYSRNTWLAVGVAIAVAGAVRLRLRWGSGAVLVGAVVAAAVGVAVLFAVDVVEAFDRFNSVREGSLDSRTAIYAETWRAVADAPVPIFGSGIKERVPGLVASLGTHSAYLGILYRGGWIAAACFLLWISRTLLISFLNGSALAAGAATYAAIWFLAEDFDAGHLTPLAFIYPLALTYEWSRNGNHWIAGRADHFGGRRREAAR